MVKVEPPGAGDLMREMEPRVGGKSVFFENLNRNKKSVCLDLKNTAGREAFLKMAAGADVMVESFRPGVLERLGVGYEAVSAANPGLIFCSVNGYGSAGPLSGAAGHDLNYLAISGILSQLREAGGAPIVPGVQFADVGGGSMSVVIGILLALVERGLTGKGQKIEISMTDALAPWLVYPWSLRVGVGHGGVAGSISGRFPRAQWAVGFSAALLVFMKRVKASLPAGGWEARQSLSWIQRCRVDGPCCVQRSCQGRFPTPLW
ncbi:CoA transferase [bacterium]|nr:MAG: CoA transferase [bacterium]